MALGTLLGGATTPKAASTAGNPQAGQTASKVVPVVPFIRASGEHVESTGIDVTKVQSTSMQDLGVQDIPAYGFLRSLLILVEATGGAGTSVVATEDAPFNALAAVSLSEPNGAVLPSFNSGYELYLADKYGGYRAYNDPRASYAYSLTVGSSMNYSFLLRVPIEVLLRDGLGSLPNQNSGATYKLRLQLAAIGTMFTGTLTTPPSVRIRVFSESWDPPLPGVQGQTQQTDPPAVNTTQFWSVQPINVSAGQQTIRLSRVGNYIRNLIFIDRRAGTARTTGDADWPDPLTVTLNTRPVELRPVSVWKHYIQERYGYGGTVETANGRDYGVFPLDFCHEYDGKVGRENRDLWLPTSTADRLEITGNFATAGVVTVLTNDVVTAGNVFL